MVSQVERERGELKIFDSFFFFFCVLGCSLTHIFSTSEIGHFCLGQTQKTFKRISSQSRIIPESNTDRSHKTINYHAVLEAFSWGSIVIWELTEGCASVQPPFSLAERWPLKLLVGTTDEITWGQRIFSEDKRRKSSSILKQTFAKAPSLKLPEKYYDICCCLMNQVTQNNHP